MARYANSAWKIEIDTTPLATATYVEIGGIEDIDWGLAEETWEGFFLKDQGAGSSDVLAGRLNVSLSGKREEGDAGQDYIMGLMGTYGAARKSTLRLTHSTTSDQYTIPCSIEITAPGGGASEDLSAFECTLHSDGAWTASA